MIVVSYFDPLQLKAKSYEERQQSHRILKPRIDHCRLRKLIRKLVFMGNFASFTVNKLEVQHFTIIYTGLTWKERPLITVVNLYFTIIRSLLQKYIWHPKTIWHVHRILNLIFFSVPPLFQLTTANSETIKFCLKKISNAE